MQSRNTFRNTFFIAAFGLVLSMQAFAQDSKAPAFRFFGTPSTLAMQERLAKRATYGMAGTDTVRILAIRAEFQLDSLAETTGDGKFIMQPPESPTIDPPPHDREYFEAQLQALANYYRTVSNGKLILTWEVLPRQNDAAYLLPNEMKYYAPGEDSADEDMRLSELLQDAFTVADTQDDIDFAAYQDFMVFHAGVGRDLNFDFDPTPNDVPSAFLSYADLKTTLGQGDPNYPGIPVQNGAFHIREGIILPETQSQEGFEIGLLGTEVILYGFQLGLPALFNTDNGLSGIGRWGMMDQGSGNFQGMIPAEPSAWEKVFMGWDEPIVIHAGKNFKVAAPRETLSPNRIYKIPIDADEYFLLENRQRDLNGDEIAIGRDVNGNRVEFNERGELIADTTIGVIVTIDEYDFGIPGSGILIWHIDESVIHAKLAENRINSDKNHRGVDLVEADGAQDIGQFYGFLHPGSGSETGVPEDAWHKDNPINTLVNNSDVVRFAPNTMPSSRSYSGANSHIVIDNFSANAPLMSFDLSNDILLPGFPKSVGDGVFPPQAAELDASAPGKEIVVARRDGAILAWRGDGSPLAGDGVLLQLDGGLASPPAFADLNGDGNDELLAAVSGSKLVVFTMSGGKPKLLWQIEDSLSLAYQVAVHPTQNTVYLNLALGLRIYSASGELLSEATSPNIWDMAIAGDYIFTRIRLKGYNFGVALLKAGQTQPAWEIDIPGHVSNIAIADLDNDGTLEFIAGTWDGRYTFFREDGSTKAEIQPWPMLSGNGLAIGDVDGDGRKDLVLNHPSGVYAASMAGAALENFPVLYRNRAIDTVAVGVNEPILIDVDGDGAQEIVATGASKDLFVINHEGRILDGFPVAISFRSFGTVGAADVNGDGELELLAVTDSASLKAYRLPGAAATNRHAWPFWRGGPRLARANVQTETPKQEGGELLPENLAYNYPNPTEGNQTTIRYRLNGPASSVKIRIFDMAGDLVDEFAGPVMPFMDNEVKWSLANIQSGVYLARVEARGESGSAVAVFKIAVVK